MGKQKTLFDEQVDELRRKLSRLERRRQQGMPAAEAITVDTELLEMLIEDHDDLKS